MDLQVVIPYQSDFTDGLRYRVSINYIVLSDTDDRQYISFWWVEGFPDRLFSIVDFWSYRLFTTPVVLVVSHCVRPFLWTFLRLVYVYRQ